MNQSLRVPSTVFNRNTKQLEESQERQRCWCPRLCAFYVPDHEMQHGILTSFTHNLHLESFMCASMREPHPVVWVAVSQKGRKPKCALASWPAEWHNES